MQPKYGSKVKLCYVGSFMYDIEKKNIAHHHTSSGIYACFLPHMCWKSPERVFLLSSWTESWYVLEQNCTDMVCKKVTALSFLRQQPL